MHVFDAAATRDALPFERLIPALRAMFVAGCEVPARHVHQIGDVTSLLMPAWQPGGYYGVKVVNVAPGNAARGLPGVHGSYLLLDANTGQTLALIEGSELTARRTAAASALAGSWLAPRDAHHLLVVGAGRIAALLPQAYRVVRPITHVTVWARDPGKAQELAAQWRPQGFEVGAATRLDDALAQAQIVSCTTPATEPLVHGRCLAPGSHLDLIGSYTPAMREADDDAFRGAGLWVDTEEALQKSGDLLGPMARGVFGPADLRGTLTQLARGEAAGRIDASERTVFKSVGSALEDLAAAMLVVQRAP